MLNHVSLLKGHIQRLDGHYVRSCGFKKRMYIASSINVVILVYLTVGQTVKKQVFRKMLYIETLLR